MAGRREGLFEDLALVELSSLVIIALPLPVLVNQFLAFLRLGVQLSPSIISHHEIMSLVKFHYLPIAGIVDLPILTELKCQLLALKDPDTTD